MRYLKHRRGEKKEYGEEVFSDYKACLGNVGTTCVWTPQFLKNEKEEQEMKLQD